MSNMSYSFRVVSKIVHANSSVQKFHNASEMRELWFFFFFFHPLSRLVYVRSATSATRMSLLCTVSCSRFDKS